MAAQREVAPGEDDRQRCNSKVEFVLEPDTEALLNDSTENGQSLQAGYALSGNSICSLKSAHIWLGSMRRLYQIIVLPS